MIELELNKDNVFLFYETLRENDRQELSCFVKNREEFYKLCLENLPFYFLGDKNFIPIAMGGVKKLKNRPLKTGLIWLLSTKKLNSYKFYIYKYVREKIELFKKEYDILYNYIYKTNFSSLVWLKMAGFCAYDLTANPDFKLFYFIKGDYDFDIRYFACE